MVSVTVMAGCIDEMNDGARSNCQVPTVLVVDDEVIVCMFVLAALQHRGYKTISAQCGEVGLRNFSEHQPEIDLVISDIMMPDISGYKMVEAIRGIRPDVPVLFITGTMNDLPAWARGTCGVFRKPCS